MTIPQAIAELEDRGVPEVITLLLWLQNEIERGDARIAQLQQELDKLKYGEF